MIELVALLGNHGSRYARNRHNVAWRLAGAFSFSSALAWQGKFRGSWAAAEVAGAKRHFLMPETFMNLSGQSVAELARFHKIGIESILVVHDELELPFGVIGLKKGGGLGGHNGLRSANASLGGPDFLRLRIGIGRPDHDDVAGYVLSDFTREEEEGLPLVVAAAAGAVERCLAEGFDAVEPEYRKRKVL